MITYRVDQIISYRPEGCAEPIDFRIVRVRLVKRGARAGQVAYELAAIHPFKLRGRTIAGLQTSDAGRFGPPKALHGDQTAAAAGEHLADAKQGRELRAAARRAATRKTAGELDAQPGDLAWFRGPAGEVWPAEVVKINTRTGKLGIDRDPTAIARAEERAELHARINLATGAQFSTTVRELRWIAPGAVVRLVRAGQVVWQVER